MKSLYATVLALTIILPFVAQAAHFVDCSSGASVSDNKICCSDGGLPKGCECFEITDASGFTNTLFTKPQCPSDIPPTFTLYTAASRSSGHHVSAGSSSVGSATFSSNKKTIFLAHGFTDAGTSSWIINMKNALLDDGDKNVVIVNWHSGAKGPNYFQATANTRTIGAMVGRLIVDMHQYAGIAYNQFHLVGHSLGSHVMGYAAKEVIRLTGSKVGRITGLDPAGPGFETFASFVRLDKGDAQFVDAIHTNGEPLAQSGFGIAISIGHADFYVNGGKSQPGCPADSGSILDLIKADSSAACSHSRATVLFTNSINRCNWPSPTSGSSCKLGYHVSTSCRGDHYPTTTSSSPYC